MNNSPGKVRLYIRRHWPVLLVITVLFASVSSESFWIDEITTAWLASQPTFHDFLEALASTGSEAQMPVFVIYIWIWAKLFGTSELALRCANMPWALIAVAVMQRLLSQSKCRNSAIILLIAPILCYYMNEARPYIMTFSTAALTITALEAILAHNCNGRPARISNRIIFPFALVLCAGNSMLNLFILPAILAYGFARILFPDNTIAGSELRIRGKIIILFRSNRLSITLAGVALVIFSSYYFWTIARGHGGQKQPFALANLGFALYEWLGFGGLGSPRNELRELGFVISSKQYYPTIMLGFIAWSMVGLIAAVRAKKVLSDALFQCMFIALLCGSSTLILTAVFTPASLWGRHFMFLMPFFIVILGKVVMPAEFSNTQRWNNIVFFSLIAVFMISSCRQRFLNDYKKDPYRDTINELRKDAGPYQDLPIIWVSYDKAISIYGGECIESDKESATEYTNKKPRVIVGVGWSTEEIRKWTLLHSKYILVMHRPDKFDPEDNWRNVTKLSTTTQIWQKGNIRIYHVGNK